jgi:secreted PhoX family phosphatase
MNDVVIGEGQVVAVKDQVLFSGTVDSVQTVDFYGQPNGKAPAKEGHDFIGITEAGNGSFLISVNHETRNKDEMIGDGGGMTSFKVTRNDDLQFDIVEQTLADGREGKFFNVDFVNTVGETWTNCGGIIAPDGRIWTAEEYPRMESWGQGNEDVTFLSDTGDVIIGEGIMVPFNNPAEPAAFDGERLKAFEGQGWMVEIDPMTGEAIRKQYNWGRMSFEAGCIMPDNKTVFLAEDERPGILVKFVADNAGDFTSGKLYAFKQDGGDEGNWVELDNSNMEEMINMKDTAWAKSATLFIRLEWITEIDGKVYICETGYDNVNKKSSWTGAVAIAGEDAIADHHKERATDQGTQFTVNDDTHYYDYYGRILVYDPETDEVSVFLEGGPDYAEEQSQTMSEYPAKHLSNPDGLGKIQVNGKWYLIINEDLNGSSYNRLPSDAAGWGCEMYIIDPDIENPTIDDLTRIMVGPNGAELTGGNGTPDGKTILVDIQHPSGSNDAPYNKAVTVALNGFDTDVVGIEDYMDDSEDAFVIYPNPVYQTLYFNGTFDVELFDARGTLIKQKENTGHLNISELKPGVYYIRNNEGVIKKLIKN